MRYRASVVCSGLALLWLGSRAPAQAPAGSAAPQGSYLRSCGAFRFDGTTLNATCKGNGNARSASALDVKACEGDIWNDSGYLRCYARTGTWGAGNAIPRGSYLQSCSNGSVQRLVLTAHCTRRGTGFMRGTDSSLDLKQCRMGSNISNIDGQLVCIN